jgi:hypothetical protein
LMRISKGVTAALVPLILFFSKSYLFARLVALVMTSPRDFGL